MKDQVLLDKSIDFAAKIYKLDQYLTMEKKEFVISKQILHSATSIGSTINEAQFTIRKTDSVTKLQDALKNASETAYWLRLLNKAEVIDDVYFESLLKDCSEVNLLLEASVDTIKKSR